MAKRKPKNKKRRETKDGRSKKYNKNTPAIPTLFNGVQYKSRLEARVAAFFLYARIRFEYEPSNIIRSLLKRKTKLYYLPDFYIWLPGTGNYFIEVKPDSPSVKEKAKACVLAEATNTPVLFHYGLGHDKLPKMLFVKEDLAEHGQECVFGCCGSCDTYDLHFLGDVETCQCCSRPSGTNHVYLMMAVEKARVLKFD